MVLSVFAGASDGASRVHRADPLALKPFAFFVLIFLAVAAVLIAILNPAG